MAVVVAAVIVALAIVYVLVPFEHCGPAVLSFREGREMPILSHTSFERSACADAARSRFFAASHLEAALVRRRP